MVDTSDVVETSDAHRNFITRLPNRRRFEIPRPSDSPDAKAQMPDQHPQKVIAIREFLILNREKFPIEGCIIENRHHGWAPRGITASTVKPPSVDATVIVPPSAITRS